jgi:hypothetical protein
VRSVLITSGAAPAIPDLELQCAGGRPTLIAEALPSGETAKLITHAAADDTKM